MNNVNFLTVFEQRIGGLFGATAQGLTAPFSFKKLAKKAAREMEAETFVIDGVDTAPALYTILVSTEDDLAMRPLYRQLTHETAQFIEGQAQNKGYVFVGHPLVRFMADPSLKSGRFSIFAENVDVQTLARLREEEAKFIGLDAPNSSGIGGAATQQPRRQAAVQASDMRAQNSAQQPMGQPISRTLSDTDAGLDVLPQETVLAAEEAALSAAQQGRSSSIAQRVEDFDELVVPPVSTKSRVPVNSAISPLKPIDIHAHHATGLRSAHQASHPAAAMPLINVDVANQSDESSDSSDAPVSGAHVGTPSVTPRHHHVPAFFPHDSDDSFAASAPDPVPATMQAPQASAAPAPPAAPVEATCLLIDRQSGRTYTAQAPSTIIGRERTAHGVVLRDPNVSRRHAELTFDGSTWHIRDLNSTNGTLVNDVDIDACPLRDGDLITFGLVNLEFREN